MSRTLLITGGQGFLGRYLAAHWLARHPDAIVVAVGRSPRRDDRLPHDVHVGDRAVAAPLPDGLRAALATSRYRYERVDLADPQAQPALAALVSSVAPTYVVHLAAALRDEPLDRLVATNVLGTTRLLEAIAGASVRPTRIVLGSSAAIYGAVAEDALPVRETTPPQPLDPYGASKRAGEEMARLVAARHGLPVVWARIFNPIGPGQDERHLTSGLALQLAEIAAGRRPAVVRLGALDTTRDYLDARDVARALALIAERGESGTSYNVASGVETSGQRILDEALRAAALGPVRIEARDGHPAGVRRSVADVSRLGALGFAPEHALADSVGSVLSYYRGEVQRAAQREPSTEEGEPDAPLEVSATATHRYVVEVESGLLARVPSRLRALSPTSRPYLLTDERVHRLYGERLLAALREQDPRSAAIVLPEGEAAKALGTHERAIAELRAAGFDRRAVLVCLGGGVVTDVGGFVAATYMRGVAYVNVPTTLLAQHDSAIGGKVAVNTDFAKNFVGAFHHPRAVFVDPETLRTLDERNIAAGVAEAIKVALCGDGRLFELLEREVDAILRRRDGAVLTTVVRRSARRKIELLAPDPYEVDLRRALNLGHSFGHPLETEMEYAGILHGEAVGFGIAVATEVSRARGVCDDATAERIHRLLRAYGLPPRVPRERLHAACARMAEVRLVRGQQLHFVLPAAIDRVTIVPTVSDAEIRRAIDAVALSPLLGDCVLEAAC